MKTTPAIVSTDSPNARIVAQLEARQSALKANELAILLGVTRQHVYKMAAQQDIPSFRLGKAVRFDPHQVAEWLRRRMPQPLSSPAGLSLAV